jgi:hypothetical protein
VSTCLGLKEKKGSTMPHGMPTRHKQFKSELEIYEFIEEMMNDHAEANFRRAEVPLWEPAMHHLRNHISNLNVLCLLTEDDNHA